MTLRPCHSKAESLQEQEHSWPCGQFLQVQFKKTLYSAQDYKQILTPMRLGQEEKSIESNEIEALKSPRIYGIVAVTQMFRWLVT